MARLFGTLEGKSTKPAKKGGDSALVVSFSDRNRPEYKLLYTGGGKLQVFDARNELLKTLNLKDYE